MVRHKKRGNMLNKKLLRDILSGWKSFMAVLVICMLSVTLYCGINGSAMGMQRCLDEQFAACNLADLWIAGEISGRQAGEISRIPGVLDAQRRVTGRATVKNLPGEPELDLFMSDEDARINRPMLAAGGALTRGVKNQCILAEAFANTHSLAIGDRLVLDLLGMPLELLIAGIGYQAEYVVYSDGTSMQTDAARFGYATVSEGTLAMFPYTGTSVLAAPGADVRLIKEAVEALVDDAQKKVTLREDIIGVRMAVEEVEQVHALGQVFPAVFFFVAALITWSTMKRLVDNQRQQIGTLRSQGYGSGTLIWHYTSYGLWIAVLGSALGLLMADLFLGRTVINMLGHVYVLPGVKPYVDPVMSAAVSALTVTIATGASFLSCRRSLRESPSALLRPRPPAMGRRVFLEGIPFLWRHVSFSGKMVVRNILRNIPRVIIGVVGVVGCTTLLLTGFGLRDSVKYVLENHYGYTMRYGLRVTLNKAQLSDGYLDALRKRANAREMEGMMETGIEVWLAGGWQSKRLFVLENEPAMVRVEDAGQNPVKMPMYGALITEKFGEETGLKPGDTVLLRAANGKTANIQVEGTITMQLGQGLYLSRLAYRYLDVLPYSPTVLMLCGPELNPRALDNMDGVNTVRTLDEERAYNGTITQVMDLLVILMVLFSGALALVVLYTLAQINFFERQRELATLMVLGFYPRENKRVILRENTIIVALSVPFGLLFGPHLHGWVLHAGLPNTLEFIPYIAPASWIYTPVLAVIFAQMVNYIIGGKFKKVDMVEALKSVE
ncbi:MAG: ABC transporter permease [Clostridia bacterium]|nr:ABC transporter permease [Clostridia bacterium]